MYDMYPEWGPAKNRHFEGTGPQAPHAETDRRDEHGERPDDN